MSRCFLGPAGRENGAFNHLSLTGEQLLYLMQEHLNHLADYIGGLHPDVQAWYDLLLSLAEKGLFSCKLLIPPSYFPENKREIHPSVQEWLRGNLKALKSKNQRKRTVADDEKLLHEFHDIFNRVFFKGALPWEKCTLRFIRKEDASGKWRSKAKGVSIKLGSTPDDCRTLIRIYERLEEHSEKRLLDYMSTLLHEMTHCLAYSYSCGVFHVHRVPITHGE